MIQTSSRATVLQHSEEYMRDIVSFEERGQRTLFLGRWTGTRTWKWDLLCGPAWNDLPEAFIFVYEASFDVSSIDSGVRWLGG